MLTTTGPIEENSTFTYPYDPTGKNPDNLIVDPPHAISPSTGKGYSVIVPKAGVFFKAGFKAYAINYSQSEYSGDRRELTPYVDYVFSHLISDVSNALQSPVYGSITIVNPDFLGSVSIEYQTLGGEFSFNEDTFTEYAIHLLEADGAYEWAKLSDIPEAFEPADHTMPLELTAGYDDLVKAVKDIGNAGDHMHSIRNIRHLDSILNNKVDAGGRYKLLSNKARTFNYAFNGTVLCSLPKSTQPTMIQVTLKIATAVKVSTLVVSGLIKPFDDGMVGDIWDNINIVKTTDTWEGDVSLSYDAFHNPCIYLGRGQDWDGATVAIIDYFTTVDEKSNDLIRSFAVVPGATLTGLNFIEVTPT